MRRFDNIPDMLELDHLTVSGDVTFGKNVVLKVGLEHCIVQSVYSLSLLSFSLFPYLPLQGTVIIIANHGDRIDIPAGAYLENKIVSGNLRILDH